jgi:hypothetical protein
MPEGHKGMADQGGVFFGYFLLATQKNVFSRRAAPGNVINRNNF